MPEWKIKWIILWLLTVIRIRNVNLNRFLTYLFWKDIYSLTLSSINMGHSKTYINNFISDYITILEWIKRTAFLLHTMTNQYLYRTIPSCFKYLKWSYSTPQIVISFIQKVRGQVPVSIHLFKQQSMKTSSLFEPLGRSIRNTCNMVRHTYNNSHLIVYNIFYDHQSNYVYICPKSHQKLIITMCYLLLIRCYWGLQLTFGTTRAGRNTHWRSDRYLQHN